MKPEQQKLNNCLFCGKECEKEFCSNKCEKAWIRQLKSIRNFE